MISNTNALGSPVLSEGTVGWQLHCLWVLSVHVWQWVTSGCVTNLCNKFNTQHPLVPRGNAMEAKMTRTENFKCNHGEYAVTTSCTGTPWVEKNGQRIIVTYSETFIGYKLWGHSPRYHQADDFNISTRQGKKKQMGKVYYFGKKSLWQSSSQLLNQGYITNHLITTEKQTCIC